MFQDTDLDCVFVEDAFVFVVPKIGSEPCYNMHEICWFLHLQVIPQTMADVEEVQSPLPKGSLFTAGSIAANTPRVLLNTYVHYNSSCQNQTHKSRRMHTS